MLRTLDVIKLRYVYARTCKRTFVRASVREWGYVQAYMSACAILAPIQTRHKFNPPRGAVETVFQNPNLSPPSPPLVTDDIWGRGSVQNVLGSHIAGHECMHANTSSIITLVSQKSNSTIQHITLYQSYCQKVREDKH